MATVLSDSESLSTTTNSMLEMLPSSLTNVNQLASTLAYCTTYAFPAYFVLLLTAYILRPSKTYRVPSSVEFVHNVFLSLQSVGLMIVNGVLYMDTQKKVYYELAAADGKESSDLSQSESHSGGEGLTGPYPFPLSLASNIHIRIQSQYFELALVCFLLSKLYEALDTVMLILNGKQLLLLHVWHHATTFPAFYLGLFTGAGFWIGMLNSFIHVIMYLYYARVQFIKPFAKYITSLQIFHLFGGVVLNLVTYCYPGEIRGVKEYDMGADGKFYSALNLFFCFSYFFLFLAFFSKKYQRDGKPASVWTLLRLPKKAELICCSIVKGCFGGMVFDYLCDQGLFCGSSSSSSEAKKPETVKKLD